MFITVDKIGSKEGDGTDEMRRVTAQLGTFQHEHSMVEFPRLQFWHVEKFFYKSAHRRLPELLKMADRDGKALREMKVTVEQLDFWQASGAGS